MKRNQTITASDVVRLIASFLFFIYITSLAYEQRIEQGGANILVICTWFASLIMTIKEGDIIISKWRSK